MTHRIGRIACVALSVAFMLAVGPHTDCHAAESEASSVIEFMAAQDKWPQLIGRPLKLEGRYTVFSSTELRFAGCPMRFLLPKTYFKPRGDSRNLEVSGALQKQNGQLVFVVQEVKSRPSDEEALRLQRALLDTSRPESYIELGQKLRERGKFYEDQELLAAAEGLLEAGLERAAEKLSGSDAAGLRALAEQASSLGLSERIRLRYLHESNRAAYDALKQQSMPDYRPLLNAIKRDFPGFSQSLTPDQTSLQKDYREAPLAVYRVADDATRRAFERIFYSEVLLASIESTAQTDGGNGEAIASRIESELPEFAHMARDYRERELKYYDSRLSALTRQQMLDFAARYDQRGEPELGTDVKRRWLKSREPQATADGPRGLMDLGEEYLNLLQDQAAAARMFQLAYAANPQLTTASQWLTEHGYELRDGRWTLPGGQSDSGSGDFNTAIHEGRVQEGMTGEQVRAALGGAPSTVVRMASAGQIAEVWLYADLGVSVQLARSSHQKVLTVRKVTDAP